MQLYHCSLILLHLHQPCYGGFKHYLARQKKLKKWATTVCGIAMSCSDYASSVMSSQCVFIGRRPHLDIPQPHKRGFRDGRLIHGIDSGHGH